MKAERGRRETRGDDSRPTNAADYAGKAPREILDLGPTKLPRSANLHGLVDDKKFIRDGMGGSRLRDFHPGESE